MAQTPKGFSRAVAHMHNENGVSFTWLLLPDIVEVDPTQWLNDDYTLLYTHNTTMVVPGDQIHKRDVGALLQSCMDNKEAVSRQPSSIMATWYHPGDDQTYMVIGELRATEDTYSITDPNILMHVFVTPDVEGAL
jgi:hypothetical protein